jgi:hypothetical protein
MSKLQFVIKNIDIFLSIKFLYFLVSKTLNPDTELDPDPHQKPSTTLL